MNVKPSWINIARIISTCIKTRVSPYPRRNKLSRYTYIHLIPQEKQGRQAKQGEQIKSNKARQISRRTNRNMPENEIKGISQRMAFAIKRIQAPQEKGKIFIRGFAMTKGKAPLHQVSWEWKSKSGETMSLTWHHFPCNKR